MAEGQAAATQPASQHDAARAVVDSWFKPEPATPEPQKKAVPQAKAEPEAVQAQAPAEDETEAAAPESGEPEAITPQEQRRLKLKYKGSEIEKDEPEVIELAQKGFDYTQKSQALAKERSELQEQTRKQIEQGQKHYSEQLKFFETALWHAIAPEMRNIDWNALARDDPAQWAQKMQAATNVNNLLNAVRAEQGRILQQGQARVLDSRNKQIAETNETLQNDIPGWNAALYESVMKAGMGYGFNREEVTNMVDSRAIKVLHDAMKYRQLQAGKPEVEKRVASVPKVMKPGVAAKTDPEADKMSQAMTKLRKTGKDKDAIAVARQLI